MNILKKIYNQIFFYPQGILGLFNPAYFDRKAILKEIDKNKNEINGIVLDFGCGKKPYEKLFNSKKYIGLDIENKYHQEHKSVVDLFYDGKKIPLKNNSIDNIVSIQSFQYIFNNKNIVKEFSRILKKKGKILIISPYLCDITERPFDMYRYTEYSLTNLFENIGFKKIKFNTLENNIIHINSYLLNMYIYKKLSKNKNYLLISFSFLISFFINLFGIMLGLFFPKGEDFYLNNSITLIK